MARAALLYTYACALGLAWAPAALGAGAGAVLDLPADVCAPWCEQHPRSDCATSSFVGSSCAGGGCLCEGWTAARCEEQDEGWCTHHAHADCRHDWVQQKCKCWCGLSWARTPDETQPDQSEGASSAATASPAAASAPDAAGGVGDEGAVSRAELDKRLQEVELDGLKQTAKLIGSLMGTLGGVENRVGTLERERARGVAHGGEA